MISKSSTPTKWKKHLVLVEFGFRTLENLQNQIHRYSLKDYDLLIKYLYCNLKNNEISGIKSLYTISFVSDNGFYKLPNFTVKNFYDLEELRRKIQEIKRRL